MASRSSHAMRSMSGCQQWGCSDWCGLVAPCLTALLAFALHPHRTEAGEEVDNEVCEGTCQLGGSPWTPQWGLQAEGKSCTLWHYTRGGPSCFLVKTVHSNEQPEPNLMYLAVPSNSQASLVLVMAGRVGEGLCFAG